MPEPLNVCFAVSARKISHRDIDDLQPQFRCGKEQFEIAEGIKLAKIFSPGYHSFVIVPRE